MEKYKKAFGISLALTAGVALLLAVAPGSLGSGLCLHKKRRCCKTPSTAR